MHNMLGCTACSRTPHSRYKKILKMQGLHFLQELFESQHKLYLEPKVARSNFRTLKRAYRNHAEVNHG